MVLHSIIIPHRDRHDTLEACLWSIDLSARVCGARDYEVLVVEHGSQRPPRSALHGVRIVDTTGRLSMGETFNKPKLQNVGINESTGDVLTFLDADAVVGPDFMDMGLFEALKRCYRVRLLAHEQLRKWQTADFPEALYYKWFSEYDDKPLAFEAYGTPERRFAPDEVREGPLFGNSHFSIHRDKLGDLRFDEAFSCHGYEDIVMNWKLWQEHLDEYDPILVSEPARSVLCFQHSYNDGRWFNPELKRANEQLYFDTVEGRREYGRVH